MRAGRTGLLLALLVLPGASASLAGLKQQPGIRVAGVDLVELGLLEQRFAELLRVRNPNGVELPITGLSFDIDVNGLRFVSGLSEEAVTVPRFGEGLLDALAHGRRGGRLPRPT